MSYFADHLAWQQRVAQEFKAQSTNLDNQMYQMHNGQWYNYPDLINYLKTSQASINEQTKMTKTMGNGFNQPGSVPQAMFTRSKQGFNEDPQIYGYSGKANALSSNGRAKRSKTGQKYSQVGSQYSKTPSHVGSKFDQKSTLSKNNVARFNESIPIAGHGPRSQISRLSAANSAVSQAKSGQRSIFSTQSNQQKKQKIHQAVEKLGDNEIDQIGVIIEAAREGENGPGEPNGEEENQDQVGDLPADEDNLTSVSQVQPSPSQVSNMTGRTYISQLQKQLNDEKDARQKLEGELDDLKKISSEITSQLGLLQRNQTLE